MISSGRLIPYLGYGDFKLYSDFYTILDLLEGKKVSMVYLGLKNEFIRIDITDSLMLFFSTENNKLFKITVNVGAECLLNSVSVIGLHEKTLFDMFPNLYYDDMEEVFETNSGVFFETDPLTHCVTSATVYIKEMEYESFYDFNW